MNSRYSISVFVFLNLDSVAEPLLEAEQLTIGEHQHILFSEISSISSESKYSCENVKNNILRTSIFNNLQVPADFN